MYMYMLSVSLLCCNGQILMYVSPPVQCFCRTFVKQGIHYCPPSCIFVLCMSNTRRFIFREIRELESWDNNYYFDNIHLQVHNTGMQTLIMIFKHKECRKCANVASMERYRHIYKKLLLATCTCV